MKQTTLRERDVHLMLADLASVRGRVHKRMWVRKLAAFHKLEQMLHARVPEQQVTWRRETIFDRNDVTVENHERILRRPYAGCDPECCFTGFPYDARRPPTPGDFTVGIKAEVEKLNLELLLSQPIPP